MNEDLIFDGKRLVRYGNDMWCSDGTGQGHTVVRKTGNLYQADVGNGSAACRDTAEEAVAAATADAMRRFDRRLARAVRLGDFL